MARFQSGTEIREVVLEGDERLAYCEHQRALLAAGFHRVRDPARELDYPEDAARDVEIERALHDSPDDDHTWLVYADRYIERGHPRGQLMALESAPVKNIVERAQREADARRLRLAASDVFAGGLGGRAGLSLKWRRGFIHYAKLHGVYDRGAAEDLLFELLRHPSARFLRELVIACSHHDVQDHRLLVDLLLHASPSPPLRMLHIEYDTDWHGYEPLGELGELGTVYPQLEDVWIEGDNATSFAGLALPRAKRFAFNTIDAVPRTLHAIATAPWPLLEDIELSLDRSTTTLDDVRFVFDLPALRRLRILAAPFANELVEAFIASPTAGRIELLDLRHGQLDDRAVAMLVAARDQLHPTLAVHFERTAVTWPGREQLTDANIVVKDMWRW